MRRTLRTASPAAVVAIIVGLLALVVGIVVAEAFVFHWAYQSLFDLESDQAWGATILTMFALGAIQQRVRVSR